LILFLAADLVSNVSSDPDHKDVHELVSNINRVLLQNEERINFLERKTEKIQTLEKENERMKQELKEAQSDIQKIQSLQVSCCKELTTTLTPTTYTTARTTTATPTPRSELPVIVLNGVSSGGKVEVVDVLSNTTCRQPPPYLERVTWSAGDVNKDGNLVVCGGASYETRSYTSSCYKLDSSTNQWTFHSSLLKRRSIHAAVAVEGGVWMSGGYDGSNFLSTTEFVRDDGKVQNWNDLPSGRSNHCMIDLLNGSIMITGGYPTINETWLFNIRSRSFTRAPSFLNGGRSHHACARILSPMHGFRPIVVVAGGAHSGKSVEVLDYTSPNARWQQITQLPDGRGFDYWSIRMISTSKGLFVFKQKNIYHLNYDGTSFQWEKLQQTLKHDCQYAVVKVLPDGAC